MITLEEARRNVRYLPVIKLSETLMVIDNRITELETELLKWTRKHDNADLQELKEQAENVYSIAAQAAYINALECHLKQAEVKIEQLQNHATGDAQLQRIMEKDLSDAKAEIERLHGNLNELERLFNMQEERMKEAIALWQKETNYKETLPDLENLLEWLMQRGAEAERKLKIGKGILKDISYACEARMGPEDKILKNIEQQAKKALADINWKI